jgi:hypothetical protein
MCYGLQLDSQLGCRGNDMNEAFSTYSQLTSYSQLTTRC